MWPSSDVGTTHTDAGTDVPANDRADILDLKVKFNQMRNHVSTFIQGLLDDTDAAAARTTLGAAKSGSNSDITSLTVLSDARWSLRLNADTSMATGTNTIIFNTEDSDPGNAYDSATGVWTAPATGTYSINYQVSIASAAWASAGTNFEAYVRLASRSESYAFDQFYTPTTTPYVAPLMGGSVTLFLNSGDTLRIDAYNGTASSRTLKGGSLVNTRCYLAISRVN